MKLNLSIKEMSLIAMCAALMAVFSQFSIPLPFSNVPVTLQIFGLIIISVVMGPKIATFSLIIYVLLGAIGLPVFANFNGGFSVILGPTGGYIIGFIIMAFLIGYASYNHNILILFIVSYIGVIIDLAIGTLILKNVTNMSLQASLAAGVYPFIIKDIIIVAISILLGLKIKNVVKDMIPKNATA